MKIVGVILAGGQSTRMGGGDKSLLDLGGKPLLTHVIERLAPQVESLAINANGDATRFDMFELPVVADSIDGFAGPLAGVLAGLDWAASQGADYIATAAADTPFFPENLVKTMRAELTPETPLAMAMTPDPDRKFARHPTFGLWPVNLSDDLRAALQNDIRKVIQWTEPHGCAKVMFDEINAFFNVNTPDDMIKAEKMLKGSK